MKTLPVEWVAAIKEHPLSKWLDGQKGDHGLVDVKLIKTETFLERLRAEGPSLKLIFELFDEAWRAINAPTAPDTELI